MQHRTAGRLLARGGKPAQAAFGVEFETEVPDNTGKAQGGEAELQYRAMDILAKKQNEQEDDGRKCPGAVDQAEAGTIPGIAQPFPIQVVPRVGLAKMAKDLYGTGELPELVKGHAFQEDEAGVPLAGMDLMGKFGGPGGQYVQQPVGLVGRLIVVIGGKQCIHMVPGQLRVLLQILVVGNARPVQAIRLGAEKTFSHTQGCLRSLL